MIGSTSNLTQSQMLIWMGQKISPSDPLYNMIFTFEINGLVHVEYFEKAFNTLLERNDVLRSVIVLVDDSPKQVFYDRINNPLEVIDVSGSQNGYQHYLRWVDENKRRVFETDELLYHAVLFKIRDNRFVFYFNQHHLITDAWSTQNCYDELNSCYQQLLNSNEESEKKTANFQSYATNNPFQIEKEISPYWLEKKYKINELPSLYGIKVTTATSNSTRINFDLGKERTQQLMELIKEADIRAWTNELALSNVFLTALAAFVYKVGNKEEFTIGVPFHNRTNENERKTIGLFMELLPLSTAVTEGETLLSLFGKIKNESLEVIKNAMTGTTPLALLKSFNVVMNFTQTKFSDFAGSPMECHWLLSDHVDPSHLIRLQIHDFNTTGGYQLLLDLNNDVFSDERIERVGHHFIQILDYFIADKNKKIAELPIITDTEIEKITSWNNTSVEYPTDETLLSKFKAQVVQTPDETALVFEGTPLTYLELNEKSNQVAHFLIGEGIKRNDIIAVSLDRSIEMMVYIYGILKAGAAYLPIDVMTPMDRIVFILENARAKILVLNHNQIKDSEIGSTSCYSLEVINSRITELERYEPLVEIDPEDLAYVIYTSGSTGEPKGVKCHHRGICNRLNWMNEAYPIDRNDTFLQKTPITFDVSVWELFWPLQVGAKLIVLVPEGHKNPEGLLQTIIEYNVSGIHFVPSMFNVFLDTPNVEKCVSLQRVFCSGESLSVHSVEKAHQKLSAEVYNLYGPTEASIDVSSWHCRRDDVQDVIPIGYPVPNTQLYILDQGLNQVPIGARGELYIAGTQLAHGYLNNIELTKERFVKTFFSTDEHVKMYRSGDLARYREDGAIEYLGRIDTQIKLRGLRIELGEVERSIEKHPDVTQAVVKVEKRENGQEYLLAFYTGLLVDSVKIVDLLERTLLYYMIPSVFIHKQAFEFLSSGKVNRKKLQLPANINTQKTKPYLPPTNEFEEIIANTWMEILQLEKIGIDENFIRLGGNSLNAMSITSRLKTVFELDLPITLVFEHPTIQLYAVYVENLIIELLSE